MKNSKRILTILLIAVVMISLVCVPAFAITEDEVEAQVAASGKGAVAGNVLIWFLCAVAFLKVSQKIDSFLASLGVNVGHAGGSLLGEAMIAMRTISMVMGGGRGFGRTGSAAASAQGAGSSGMSGFFKGGLIGMASRHITNSAVKTATTQTAAVHTVQRQTAQAAETSAEATAPNASVNNEIHNGDAAIHNDNSVSAGAPSQAGVIAADAGTPSAGISQEGMPPVSSAPSDAPPQDGVIITDTGITPQGTIEDGGTIPADMPSEGGVNVTGVDTSIHAPQSGGSVHINSVSSTTPEGTAGNGSNPHTHTKIEHVQASHNTFSSEKVQNNHSFAQGGAVPTLGGMVFSHSLAAGGSFANDVIGMVARGEVAGTITGDMAAQALHSYMGYTASEKEATRQISFRNVEIGGGRITGVEYSPAHPKGIAFSMYHTHKYMAPEGNYQKGLTADGQAWYRQYAVDTVVKTPFKAPDGTVDYDAQIVKRVPKPPARKDRI